MKHISSILMLTAFVSSLAAAESACDVGDNEGELSAATHYVLRNDYTSAFPCYRAVAETEPIAAYNLGVLLTLGSGTEKNDNEAIKWFTKAAHAGIGRAQYNLGVRFYWGDGVQQNYEEAYKWFYVAHDSGYTYADNALDVVRFRLNQEAVERAQSASKELIKKIGTESVNVSPEVMEIRVDGT